MLSLASERGHEGIVKVPLYRKGVRPNLPDGFYCWPPCAWSAPNGQEGMLRALLRLTDVNPKSITKGDPTPLRFAVIHGQEGEVELPNDQKHMKPNLLYRQQSQTRLSLAAIEGCESIIRLLLANNNSFQEGSDTSTCRTPLTWAALNGQQERLWKYWSCVEMSIPTL